MHNRPISSWWRLLGTTIAVAALAGCGGQQTPPADAASTLPSAVPTPSSSARVSGTASSTADPQASTSVVTAPPTPVDQQQAAGLGQIVNDYSFRMTDADGFTVEVEIRATDWIKGTDSDMIQAAYKKASGNDVLPGIAKTGAPSWSSIALVPSDSAYIVGTVTIRNVTTDYPPQRFGKGAVRFNLTVGQGAHGAAYPSLSCWANACPENGIDFIDTHDQEPGTILWSGNTWGPQSFILGVPGVLVTTPNAPDGILFDRWGYLRVGAEATLSGDTSFSVSRGWV